MNSWPEVDLNDISDISAGNPAPQGADYFCTDGHPFVRMQDVGRYHIDPALVETTDRVSSRAVRECKLRLYPAGTLLIPKSGASVNLNHRAMLGQDAYVVSHLATIIPNQRRVLPSYLFHWSQRYDPRSQAQVTSLPSLPLSLIKAAKVPLPPLDEQRRIVGLLDRAAEIRRRADAARAKARAIIPALFLDMFGDPTTNPKGWPVVKLGSLLGRIDSGWSPVCGDGAPDPDQWGVLKLSAIKFLGFIGSEAKLLPDTILPREDLEVHEGDLLFSRKNTIDLVGTAAVADGSGRKRMLPDTIFRLVPSDPARFGPRYLSTLINLPAFRPVIRQLASGSASSMPGISKGRLSTLEIPLPDLPLQTVFAEQAQRLEATARALDHVAKKAEAMAASLSAEVFG
ncbi:restriction endonuclease subunit S [Novosphingobium sp. KACC 22771]|uniref:restriction endonuclease subunit S n=1 Tax=Novosphingobium sp. KACC 22771 TaxID=3025670 RepID=UPI002366FCCC|nr:restriction endonuclease subunit S [Novosphingobium sp. KACC 22771]WDF73041.1 restriction endonuclease subunit S [Novosphingobium sp. KACC 22771]